MDLTIDCFEAEGRVTLKKQARTLKILASDEEMLVER